MVLLPKLAIARRVPILKKSVPLGPSAFSRHEHDGALNTLLYALRPTGGVSRPKVGRQRGVHTVAADAQSPTYVTTPIFYVNDVPHIGHAYTSVAADAVARFGRLNGQPTWFATGCDEHGEKVQTSAEKKGISPQLFCDEVSGSFKQLSSALDLTNDVFVRTTSAEHKNAVNAMWKRLDDAGYIYKGVYEGWYSVRDECFYTDKDIIEVNGEKVAPTGSAVEWRAKEPSYFFKLSEFEKPLLDYYEAHPDVIQPATRRKELLKDIREGLHDISISRTSFSWGISVPTDDEHVIYVWIDALTNYLTVLGWPDNEERFQTFWPHVMHIVGKDILRFHAIYWPAMLMGANLPLPKKIFAHGWWTKDGEKISKSLGNVIDPFELLETYGLDATRFFFLGNGGTFGSDADFSHRDMIRVYNGFLANSLGNLLQRVVTLSFKNLDKAAPPNPGSTSLSEGGLKLLNEARALPDKLKQAYSTISLHEACGSVESLIRNANVYINIEEPWVLKKSDPARFSVVLWTLFEVLRIAGIALAPIMPGASQKMLMALGMDEAAAANPRLDMVNDGAYETNRNALSQVEVLFPRIDDAAIFAAEKAKEDAKRIDEVKIVLEPAELEKLKDDIKSAGSAVRDAKAAGMAKEELSELISNMLNLKDKYQKATGEPYDSPKQQKNKKAVKTEQAA